MDIHADILFLCVQKARRPESAERTNHGQYPSQEAIARSSIMVFFDAEKNEAINQMWINVRCFNIHDVPWWAWMITVILVGVVVFLFIKEKSRQKLYRS